MRLASLASARPEPIDRNATITVSIYLNQNLSPATVTERWSQTIASGKKAQISTMMASIIRCTTATVPEWAYVQVSVNTTGTNDGICIAQMGHNVIGYGDSQMVGVAGTYGAGSIIKGFTADLSTGGSTRVWVGATVMTYDA
jgi:hypothetical protein